MRDSLSHKVINSLEMWSPCSDLGDLEDPVPETNWQYQRHYMPN